MAAKHRNLGTTTGGQLEAFTLEEDGKSFEGDDDPVDEEEEERAVADFASEIALNSNTELRRAPGEGEEDGEAANSEKDDEEASQGLSIDDVTDDEEGD